MRISSILRTATLALSLVATMGAMTSAFADSRVQQQEQAANAGPYDSSDFVVPATNVYP
jgi:glutamine cyclotransferase